VTAAKTAPYAVEREIEDLDALIACAGGTAAVFGYSSGAHLALQAAAHGSALTKLALYDALFVTDKSDQPLPADLPDQLAMLIAAGRRGDAVELFQTTAVGIPEHIVAQIRDAPFRPALEAVAHTLVYDATIIGDLTLPTAMIASVTAPTLVIDGENSPPMMHSAAQALTETLPDARRRTLADQTHDIAPEAVAAALREFIAP
jgi:pimeloyl-ACP methyl ester carboxylesterase